MNKAAVHHITNTLGTSGICEALGVTGHSVRYARTTGAFPASWFDALSKMCAAAVIPCPRDAFNWKPIAKKYGNTEAGIQGGYEASLTEAAE